MGLLLLCFGAASLSGACTPVMHINLPVSSIVETAETAKPTTTNADVMVKWNKPAHCGAELANVVEDLKAIGVEAKNAQCGETGTGTKFTFSMDVTLVTNAAERPAGAGLVLEIEAEIGKVQGTSITLVGMNTAGKLAELTGYEKPDFLPPQIVVDVFNDTGRDYGVQFEQVFLDHEPFMADRTFDLQRYVRAAVQLNDAASAVIAAGNANRFMTLYPQP